MRIVKVPGVDGNKNSRDSGNRIIDELRKIRSSEKGKLIDTALFDIEEIHVDNSDKEEQDRLIFENALEEFERRERVLFLGGDHSITLPIGRAFLKYCRAEREEICLIVFDAHADCLSSEGDGNKNWLRGLIESEFPTENILLVGARDLEKEEIEFLAESRVRRIEMNQLANEIQETTDIIMEFASGKNLYVSFDIDIVDAFYAPGTERAEVAGLTSRQAVYILGRIGMMKNLRGIDIVELDLEKDKNNLTLKLAGKLVSELV